MERPLLTKFMASFAQDIQDDIFELTGIQMNRNYSAIVHVDGNSVGGYHIVGLGDYTGGQLWVQDPDGDVEMVVTRRVMGQPDREGTKLKVGTTIYGKWLKSDGPMPNAAAPFEGTRISLVYFYK